MVDVAADAQVQARNEDGFPASLAWIERGSVLVRRMNSERIAEDPRLRRLLIAPTRERVTGDGRSAGMMTEDKEKEEEKPAVPELRSDDALSSPPPVALSLTPQESFERMEAVTDGGEVKQESENAASNAYKVLLWTYRVHASVQNALQYAVSSKASDDGYFVPIAPRVFSVAPAYLNTLTKLFDAHSSARQWSAAVKLLTQLDAIISKRFQTGACIFDCGLFDGVKKLHGKPLVYDEFCDGRIASISYCRGPIPSMHSAFVITSTVSAWLDLNPDNVAILLTPNNEQMSVFSTCCTLYCTEAESFPSNFSQELLEVYQQHIRGSESWPAKISRTFSGLEAKNVYYTGSNIPRPQARFVADFTTLLEMRDEKLAMCAEHPDVQERKKKLTGVTVTPASQKIYIHEIRLLTNSEEATNPYFNEDIGAEMMLRSVIEETSPSAPSSAELTSACIVYRPYFVLQNEKGVLFSSMIHGVHDAALSATSEPHVYKVGKTLERCSDLFIKMYHLPFGRQGELVVEARLHADLLLERAIAGHTPLGPDDIGEATLSVANGDFDCISAYHSLPKHFRLQVRYGRDAEAFPPPPSTLAVENGSSFETSNGNAAYASTEFQSRPSAPTFASRSSFVYSPVTQARGVQPKPVRYDGPRIVTFLLNQRNVRTAFGDVILHKIDVIRRANRGHLDIYLLFHVDAGMGEIKVLPHRYVFRYVLPEPVRTKMLDMGATEESINENAPSSFDVGTGMTFDEEYARWLQHIYDTDLNNEHGSFEGEIMSGDSVVDIRPGLSYRCVSLPIQVNDESSSPPPPARSRGPQPKTRGATSSLIQQLPTYIYSDQKQRGVHSQVTPDCLVCRCGFEAGEEIKSLPCFHSYHSDCIDSWLCLNKVCPVCQFSIDNMHQSSPLARVAM